MTTPRSQSDRSHALALADARGFGTVCAWDGQKPIAAAVPFALDYAADGTPRVAFHLALQHPLAALAGAASPWVMAVSGADAYVSADWYVSPDQVPTWLYQAARLTGRVHRMGGDELGPHLDGLSARFESWLAPKPPWTSARMTAARLQAMKTAIVGLVLTVDEVEGSFKLNQRKSDADHTAVALALLKQSAPGARQIAGEMLALRPHLFAAAAPSDNDMTSCEGLM